MSERHVKTHSPRMLQAIRNNAAWCDAVCGAYGAVASVEGCIWITRAATPSFYPNAITLNGSAEEQLVVIKRLIAGRRMPEKWALKDSFAALDLTALGFRQLFEAEWIYLQSARKTDGD